MKQPSFEFPGFNLELRAGGAVNHANFDLIHITNSYTNSQDRTSLNFGKITSAADGRIMQIALKLRF